MSVSCGLFTDVLDAWAPGSSLQDQVGIGGDVAGESTVVIS